MINLYNCDCMEFMTKCKDNAYDLAIVDPPYGIGAGSEKFINGTSKTEKKYYKKNDWDTKTPDKKYFNELIRVSKHQIIWGGNYFDLKPSQGFIVWDKKQPFNFSAAMCEYAWISKQMPAKIFRLHVVTAEKNKHHPTQKPRDLYRWLLKNYAKEGDKILDTHLGSGSIAIACYNLDFDLVGYEIDKEYYEGAVKRLEEHKKQGRLFDKEVKCCQES